MDINPAKQPIRIEYEGQEYIVKYRHDQTPDVIEGKYTELPINGKTEAFLGSYDEPVGDIIAVAYCSVHDSFSKKTGRIVSTVRLIKKLERKNNNIYE